jgi:chemotaxis protein CheZ
MSGGMGDHDLALRLEALRKDLGDTVRVDQLGDVVRGLLTASAGRIAAADLKLYHELESLARFIHQAKSEIAALRPHEIQDRYIASATDELDAIIEATERATNSILDAAEQIENLLAEVPLEISEKLAGITTQIYESCNFQDITGQRITKVVRTLKDIEKKVDGLVAAFGADFAAPERQAPVADKPLTDEDLLNGPQLPNKASRQDEIDALLASFD